MSFKPDLLHIKTLPSGIKCYIIPKKEFTTVHAMVCVKYGSVDNSFVLGAETFNMPEGMAHFLEHKMFETERGDIMPEFTALSAEVNAYTSFTNTAYHFTCARESFSACLKLLLEMTSKLYVTDESVEKEKQVITSEIRMYDDDLAWNSYYSMLVKLYPYHPLSRKIAGSVESIGKATPELLQKCFDAFYNPSGGTVALVVAGAVEPEKVYELAGQVSYAEAKQLTRIHTCENAAEPAKIPVSAGASKPFNIGFRDDMKGSQAQKIASTRVLLDIIAGRSSALFEVMYNNGIIDDSFSPDYIGGESFGVAAFFGVSENPWAVLRELEKEIERIKASGIDKEPFERIRARHIGRFIAGYDSVTAIAAAQAGFFSRGTDIDEVYNAYLSLTVQDVTDRLEMFTGAEMSG